MTIKDTLTLVTAGYTAKDIKELHELAKDKPDLIEIAKTGTKLEDLKSLLELTNSDESETEGKIDAKDGESDRDTVDYKKLYDEQSKQLEDLKKTVSEIQDKKSREDISGGEKDDSDIFAEIMSDCI